MYHVIETRPLKNLHSDPGTQFIKNSRVGKLCKRIWRANANALYQFRAPSQPISTGYYVRRSRENDFKKNSISIKLAYIEWFVYNCYWLSWRVDINHARNYGEQCMGYFVVDGTDSTNNAVYESYFHGNNCELKTRDLNKKCNLATRELYHRTPERQRYLEGRRYRVVCISECEYKHVRKTDENLQDFRFHWEEPIDIVKNMGTPIEYQGHTTEYLRPDNG